MGAFVGEVTSPFLRRRKGRVGKDVWAEKTAPPFAGARIKMALGSHASMICSPNASNTWAHSSDEGNTWTLHALPANNFIGNALEAGNPGAMRPFYEFLYFDLWHLQQCFMLVGTVTAVGGQAWIIPPEGKTVFPSFTVAARPQEAVSWSPDGACFMSCGASDAGGLIHCRGGKDMFAVGAPDQFTMGQTPGANGAWSSHSINPGGPGRVRDKEYYFLSSSSDADENLLFARRKVIPSEPTWDNQEGVNPMTDGIIGQWLVVNNLIMGVSGTGTAAVNGIRSLDNGATWSTMPGFASPKYDLWRFGRRFYICGRDNPKIIQSKNNGATWQTHPRQLPSATAIPTRLAWYWDNFYLFCHDGAVNRCYNFKPYLEI